MQNPRLQGVRLEVSPQQRTSGRHKVGIGGLSNVATLARRQKRDRL
jgi:hypothetical protein